MDKPKTLAERYRHATEYCRRKDVDDTRFGIWNGTTRSMFYRDYRQWRVFAQSGLPVKKEYQDVAYRVLVARGIFPNE